MSLAPTSRGMRLIRQTRGVAITMPPPPPPGGETQSLLVTGTGERIVTENGVAILLETA